ncbi:MAG TPA: FlgD immunoglobulin-like domain containing protein, partial [Candidatus Krumholzibacteria bacterium]|nr:FlgD immunoglobulin-like domain containing protein [Candidatus Krumholzibacteria bacterium]
TVWNVAVAEALPTQVDFALVDVLGPSFATANLPGATTDTAGPYTVTTTATDASGVAEVRAYYTSSASGGPFELPLAPTGQPGEYAGDIPGQPLGTRVQFWFTGRDVAGNASVEPAGGPFSPYAFAVIEPVAIASSDMESDDGWTSGQAGDTATTGQWVRIDPNAVINNSVYVQPEDDHTPTGTLCWITGDDPVGSAQGVADVDGGRTTLLSPVYDVSGVTSLELRYWRWYTNDTGNNPGADIWTVQAAFDGGTWFDLENTLASDRSWSEHVFALENLAPGLGDQLQLRFIAEDAGAGSVVEAGVDDVTLVGYPIAADTTAPSAAMVAPDGGEVIQGGTEYQVTWTHGDDVGVVEARIFLQTTTDGPWTELGRGPYNQAFTWQLDPVVGLPLGSQGGWDKAQDQCRIRVEVYDAVGHVTTVESAAPFTISSGQSPVPGAEPLRLALDQNRPNPFNPSTEIRFSLAKQGDVTVTVYDVNGRLVRTLVAGVLPAGPHAVTWKGDDDRGARAASGLYFCRLQAPGGTLVRKMTLLK